MVRKTRRRYLSGGKKRKSFTKKRVSRRRVSRRRVSKRNTRNKNNNKNNYNSWGLNKGSSKGCIRVCLGSSLQ